MNCLKALRSPIFYLPSKGILEPISPDDPLPYYYKPISGCFYIARIKQSLSLLDPPYKSILEMGYGSGILLPTLCSIGEEVYGIDLEADPSRVKSNLKKVDANAELIRGDIANAEYSNGSFDLVVAISVLEHIRDVSSVVKKVFDLLRPGGEFLVGMPQVGPIMAKAFRLIGYRGIERHHVTGYRKFLEEATQFFKLIKFTHLPRYLPVSLALYFNMLLRKP